MPLDKEQIDKHEKDIEELKNKAPPEMPEIDGDLNMESLLKIFCTRGPNDNTIPRLEALEEDLKAARAKIAELEARPVGTSSGPALDPALEDKVNDLLQRVNRLEVRADSSDKMHSEANRGIQDHERRIRALEAMNNAPAVGVTGEVDEKAIFAAIQKISSEFTSFKEVKYAQDIEGLRIELRGYTDKEVSDSKIWCGKKIDSALDGLRHELERLRAEFDQFKNRDFKDLEARVSALEKKLAAMMAQLQNLKIPTGGDNTGGVSLDDFNALAQKVAELEDALNHLRNEFAKWMKEMQDSLNRKADFEQVDKSMQDRLNDIVKALNKQYADRAETRKALKIHEKQFQNLYNLIMSKGGQGENEEDAMFSKKPLGGLSCASCEKGLIDMYGKRVEFMPWNKLPFRDPAERIARVGQGFSKMLSMINPDQLSRYEQQNSKMAAGHQQPMHMSQNDPTHNGNEQFYQDPNGQDMHGRTQGRFPSTNQRFQTGDGKRPGSAQGRKNVRSKQRKM